MSLEEPLAFVRLKFSKVLYIRQGTFLWLFLGFWAQFQATTAHGHALEPRKSCRKVPLHPPLQNESTLYSGTP
jgi:hypothetical protein